MMNEEKTIRFIDSHYKELFRIPDGSSITIRYNDRPDCVSQCNYMDEYHTQIGNYVYHICEFAEKMEQIGATYTPSENQKQILSCYSIHPATGELIYLERGTKGYRSVNASPNKEENRSLADQMNEKKGVTAKQEAAMLAGSLFGYHVPAANPQNYDEAGKLKKPKDKER